MAYKSPYSKQIKNITSNLLKKDNFVYDMNADAMYDIYKNQYMNQGNRDMRDVIGDFSANTGGMASSAAVNAGNSAYQSNINALGDRVTDLYSKALNKYNSDINDMYMRFNLLYQLDQQKYSEYRDGVNDDFNERQFQFQKQQAGL